MSAQTELWQGQYDTLFIGGQWVQPGSERTFEVISPATEQLVARVPEGVEADIDAAVTAAREAFDKGPWPRMSLEERITVLRKLSAELAARESEAAALVSAEMGCPITLSTKMQSIGPRMLLDAFLNIAPTYPWSDTRTSASGSALVTREPVGVVAAVVPWNAPLLITMIKLAPALLAGCTMVVKPSPETPLDAYLLGDMLDKIGLPEGVVNIVPAQREVSEYLVRHPGVDKVSFTGSTPAGRRIASLCGHDLRRVTLELGGKSAAVLLDDADLDVAVAAIRAVSLRNSGQVCSNKTRIVVARSRRDELHDRLLDLIGSMPVGDPFDPATEIGPMVSDRHRSRVEGYIADAAVLETTDRGGEAHRAAVDFDCAGADVAGNRQCVLGIGGEHRAIEAVLRVVGDLDGLGLGVERVHGENRTEDLLLRDLREGIDVGEDRGLDVPAAVQAFGAAAAHQ